MAHDEHSHDTLGRREFLCRCGAGMMAASGLASINYPALAGTTLFVRDRKTIVALDLG